VCVYASVGERECVYVCICEGKVSKLMSLDLKSRLTERERERARERKRDRVFARERTRDREKVCVCM